VDVEQLSSLITEQLKLRKLPPVILPSLLVVSLHSGTAEHIATSSKRNNIVKNPVGLAQQLSCLMIEQSKNNPPVRLPAMLVLPVSMHSHDGAGSPDTQIAKSSKPSRKWQFGNYSHSEFCFCVWVGRGD
jgi:hypothetical protein